MSDLLLPPRFLFQFSVPCFRRQPIWSATGTQLDERFRLPDLSQLEAVPSGADVRVAWGAGRPGVRRARGRQTAASLVPRKPARR